MFVDRINWMEIISKTYPPDSVKAINCHLQSLRLLLNGKRQAEIPISKLKSFALAKIQSIVIAHGLMQCLKVI